MYCKYIFVCLCLSVYSVASLGADEDISLTYLNWKLNKQQNLISDEPGRNLPWSNTSNIRPDCKAFITEFGLRSSRFVKCSVDNARPFRFCEGCVEHYQRSKNVYNDIVDNDKTLDNCRDELLNSDRVQVINSVQKDIDRIWDTADCKQCFSSISEDQNGTVYYKLTDRTKEFLEVYKNFTRCIHTNRTNNGSVCVECNQCYIDMNRKFDTMLNDPLSPQHVCMDIVDMMNYTRLTWGQKFKCSDVHKEYRAVLSIAIGFLLIPIVFYVSLAVYGTKKTRKLIEQKRLAIYQRNTSYGALDSPPLNMEQPLIDSESHDSANQSAASTETADSEYKTSSHNGILNNRTSYTFS